jgi:diguanylate cyclase (GGDEF)-like protein/PAS domain S-box-containing protein
LRRHDASSGAVEPIAIEDRLEAQRHLLARLSRSQAISAGDLELALHEISEIAAEVLDVERASIWEMASDGSRIECVDLYERSARRHSHGSVIEAASAPRYFEALLTERSLPASDAHTDPRTSEFSAGYLTPLGIGAMLDAPIFLWGRMVGVVCHEHIGRARPWEVWEELVAATIADRVSLVLQAREQQAVERELRVWRTALGELLVDPPGPSEAARSPSAAAAGTPTASGSPGQDLARLHGAIQRTASELRTLFAASPVALALIRDSDGCVVYANERAGVCLDIAVADLIGTPLTDYTVEDHEPSALLDDLHGADQIDGMEVQLSSRQRRRFWARLSARRVDIGGGGSLIGIVDITERKRAEAALRESEEVSRQLFNVTPTALVLTRAEDHVILAANPAAAELFEIPLEQAVGRRTPDFYVDPAARLAVVETTRRDGQVRSAEVELRTAGGRAFWAEISVRSLRVGREPAMLISVIDTTLRRAALAAIQQRESYLRTLIAAAPIPLVLSRMPDNEILLANERAASMFRYPLRDLIGRSASEFYYDPAERAGLVAVLDARGRADGYEVRLRTADGSPVWVLISAQRLELDGVDVVMVGFLDLTAQKDVESRLRMMATRDPLTNVYNRRQFLQRGRDEVERARRYRRDLSVAMIDADRFKGINDTHGHEVGDRVLVSLAETCTSTLRANDLLARYGGEEFAVILPETDSMTAMAVAQRLCAVVPEHAVTLADGQRLPITVSIGVSALEHPDGTLEQMLQRADQALYRAKSLGRNRAELG